jgi:hypothetical protein
MPLKESFEFTDEPTAMADEIAAYARSWYEKNRETWWQRRGKRWEIVADNFMLSFIDEVRRILEAAEVARMLHRRQRNERDDCPALSSGGAGSTTVKNCGGR